MLHTYFINFLLKISTIIVFVSSSSSSTSAASSSTNANNKKVYIRPQYIQDAIDNNKVIHYFGIGSNMLKEKVINRGLNGTKIQIINIQAGYAKNHRLAFNLPGFPPIEPAMAGIEPSTTIIRSTSASSQLPALPFTSSSALYEQQQEKTTATTESTTQWCGDECHGALITMTAAEYQKLWLSEGGGQKLPGYQEILVDVCPYNDTSIDSIQSIYNNRFINYTTIASSNNTNSDLDFNNNKQVLSPSEQQSIINTRTISTTSAVTVKAIALQAADHVRLKHDRDPSSRYMKILVQGAQELGLSPLYIQKLQNIPTAQPSAILTWMSRNHFYTTSLLFRYKLRFVLWPISKLLVFCYVSSSHPSVVRRILSEIGMGLVLLPGSLFGYLSNIFFNLIGKPYKPFFMTLTTQPQPKPTAAMMTVTAAVASTDKTTEETVVVVKSSTTTVSHVDGSSTSSSVAGTVQ